VPTCEDCGSHPCSKVGTDFCCDLTRAECALGSYPVSTCEECQYHPCSQVGTEFCCDLSHAAGEGAEGEQAHAEAGPAGVLGGPAALAAWQQRVNASSAGVEAFQGSGAARGSRTSAWNCALGSVPVPTCEDCGSHPCSKVGTDFCCDLTRAECALGSYPVSTCEQCQYHPCSPVGAGERYFCCDLS